MPIPCVGMGTVNSVRRYRALSQHTLPDQVANNRIVSSRLPTQEFKVSRNDVAQIKILFSEIANGYYNLVSFIPSILQTSSNGEEPLIWILFSQ